MKVFKCIVLILFATLMCANAGYAKSLKKTVWANVTRVEKDGVSGEIVTTLYLGKKHKVEVYKSIQHNGKLEESPYLYASGKYRCQGNNKNKARISLDLENLMKEKITYSGHILNNGIVFLMPNYSVEVYVYVNELLFENND